METLHEKYSKDGPFEDPVVRCTECQYLLTRGEVREHGSCPRCGNRRVRNVTTLSADEMARFRDSLDPDFLALFEERPDVS